MPTAKCDKYAPVKPSLTTERANRICPPAKSSEIVVTNAIAVRPQGAMRLHGRSLMAFVLTPTTPITDWLTEIDKRRRTSPAFFVGRPIILDLAAVSLNESQIGELITQLAERGIRVMALEGTEDDRLGPSLPPVLKRARSTGSEALGSPSSEKGAARTPWRQEPSSLLIENPVRSGQSIIFPNGDITVLGSVASGAEVVAGGSIHIYGTLRGRAMAGSMGNPRARIFCSKNEAELVSIDGYYRTAEEMDASLRSRPAQCWLENRVLAIAALD
jgi:septum site-determining protein MinC